MSQGQNFFRRVMRAIIEDRTRRAERYLATYSFDQQKSEAKVNER